MKKFSWLKPSLARRIGIRMSLLAVTAIFLLTYQYVQQERASSREELFTQAELVLKTTALTIRDPLNAVKVEELNDLVSKMDENPAVTLLVIYDKDGKILADSRNTKPASSQTVETLGKTLVSLPDGETLPIWLPSQLVAGQAIRNGDKVI